MRATAFSAPYYVLEQLGFRKILDVTFMMASMVARDARIQDVRKYFRALRRAQADVDISHQPYTYNVPSPASTASPPTRTPPILPFLSASIEMCT